MCLDYNFFYSCYIGSAEANRESNSVPERATKLTTKIGLRVYGHGVNQLLSVHRVGQDAIAKLVYSVELVSMSFIFKLSKLLIQYTSRF